MKLIITIVRTKTMGTKEIYSDSYAPAYFTPKGIAFYMSLDEVKQWDDRPKEKWRYEITIAFPIADQEKLKHIFDAENEIEKRAFNKKKCTKRALKLVTTENGEEYWKMTLKTKFKPGIVDATGKKILTQDDLPVGALVRCKFALAAGDHSGPYISARLIAVQKIGNGNGLPDGLMLTSGENPLESFDAIEPEGDEDINDAF